MGLTASDIVFGEATAEQRRLAWELCGQSWAAPMSLGDYVEREQHLAEHDLNRDGRCRCWVLYLKGYPRQVIASCESTRKPLLISDGHGKPARGGHGYAVTNVYTNPSYRRQGMAAFLLRRLQDQMDADSDCSVLYSDSGRSYYASLGWAPFASRQATITLFPTPSPSPSSSQQPQPRPQTPTPTTTTTLLPRTRPLQTPSLSTLCETDSHHLTKTFGALPPDNKTHIAFLPTPAQITWHLARAEFDFHKIAPCTPLTAPDATAALIQGAITLTNTAWAYWTHEWRSKSLRVLRIFCPGDADQQRVGDMAALLGAAVAEARRCGLRRVVVWNPDEEVRGACKRVGDAMLEGVKVVFEGRVDGGLPSLRWRGGGGVKGVVWEENFGFCWC
jgi:GNAT superfamily N-acetyltransferase